MTEHNRGNYKPKCLQCSETVEHRRFPQDSEAPVSQKVEKMTTDWLKIAYEIVGPPLSPWTAS